MPNQYQVKSGDVLGMIANKYGTTVSRLMRMNEGTIDHPDKIYPGQCLNVPANSESSSFSSAPASSVVDRGDCQEDFVEIIHITGTDELFFLTQSDLTEIEREEKLVCAPIGRLYREIKAGNNDGMCKIDQPGEMVGQAISPLQKTKLEVVSELEEMGVVGTSMQSTPPLTEIKRLKGNKHYTYVRSDKIANHWRSYKMTAQDRKRSAGWMSQKGIDGNKLKEAVESDFGIKFKADLWKLDPDSNLSKSLNQFYDEVSWSVWGDKDAQAKNRNETGFDASAEAQLMRFAAGAEASGEFTPSEGKVHLQAKADAQFSLAQGKASIEQAFPANDYSEIRIYYRVGGWDGKRAYATLGHFQARLTITASGYAGASAMLAANVKVDCSEGVPSIKGIAAGDSDQGVNAEAGAFAGVRGGCELLGALYWTDVLSKQSDWKALCQIGPKVEGAAGIGADVYLKLAFSEKTGKFLLKAHAGLVLGLGASGSFLLEVSAQEMLEMIHFVYNSLLKVDFRYVELFDRQSKAFERYVQVSLFALSRGVEYAVAATELATSGFDYMEREVIAFISAQREGLAKENDVEILAENLIKDIARNEKSVFRHSPPEVKGVVLYKLTYDHWLTPQLFDGTFTKVKAIGEVLKTFQGWRDFNETMLRMNPDGEAEAGVGEINAEKLFKFIGKNRFDYLMFKKTLEARSAIADRPVELDPYSACHNCGIV
ncbi:LysM peptidoglycan-binding domain-containing protein [Marinobacter halotolerans]|uniref:LysM peptidoglycan-binding domain-containing protein n=1 Tax=Marinobacter halotolerans TaxID=1569211 RepID=UPI00124726F6|nr:LysM peptidoglycan-binding domain-containing protein [Marinobacter halotolerans]